MNCMGKEIFAVTLIAGYTHAATAVALQNATSLFQFTNWKAEAVSVQKNFSSFPQWKQHERSPRRKSGKLFHFFSVCLKNRHKGLSKSDFGFIPEQFGFLGRGAGMERGKQNDRIDAF